MAYVFDYINNTLIDDEDKSLGNKLAVLDSDLEKVLKELNEKFGPGTIQEGTQGIPQPEIKTPQAIFEFEERMKGRMADGGRVNFDNGSDPFLEDLNQKLKQANINRQMGSIDFFINKFGEELLNKITQEKFGMDFKNLPTEKNDPKGTVKNFKRRLLKFEDFIKKKQSYA